MVDIENYLFTILGILIALLLVIYTHFLRCYQYWKQRNVPFLTPKFPFGNEQNPMNASVHRGILYKEYYDYFKKNNWKYAGVYNWKSPALAVTDLDLIKSILVKDSDYFMDRDKPRTDLEYEPLSAHLFNYTGTKWKNLRAKLTPTFTSGKLKVMFETLLHCTTPMVNQIEKDLSKPIDIKDYLERFTSDVIGSCAFGIECNSFKDPNTQFRTNGSEALKLTKKLIFVRMFPKIAHALGLKSRPEIDEFFIDVVNKTLNYRKDNHVKRNDFLQLLIEMKDSITFNEIASQSFLFFLAGFETSATTMTFVLYNLAKSPDIQEKLRSEIVSVLKKYNNKLTYDVLSEMKYLGHVVDETLRMFPPGTLLARICLRDFKLPNEDFIIEKGIKVLIPVYGIHHDEEYYPNPTKFDPERFNEDNRKSRPSFTYLPFGEGPRNCIGLRFGLMQVKTGIVNLLSNFKFTLNSKTEEPLQFASNFLVISPREKIWLNAEKL